MTVPHAGDQLDHYRIEALIARSGMASIFRATDLNNGQPVAIKIPHPEVECEPALFDRFRREEEIGQLMDHPGVMKVFFNDDRSQVYMVMEWVEGRLLRKILGEQPAPPTTARPPPAPSGPTLPGRSRPISSTAPTARRARPAKSPSSSTP